MDTSKLKPVKISPYTRDRIIFDFYPEFTDLEVDIQHTLPKLSIKDAPLHAGALSLYATSLITKVFETDPLFLEPYYQEREQSYKTLIKSNPKHASLSDAEVATFAKNLIIKDIRNSFAHGQFDISYDVYTRKLYFVLRPNRKDFITPEPIVISKTSLIKANEKFLKEMAYKHRFNMNNMIYGMVDDRLNRSLKELILPTQMLKLAKHYLENNSVPKQDVLYDPKLYHLIQYTLLSASITYEQDDYYKIFGKSSNIFDTISLIRNTLAHDRYEFLDVARKVNYEDQNKSLSETIAESTTKLLIASSQKQAICALQEKNPETSLDDIAKDFTDIFDFFFGGYFTFEELAEAYRNIDDNNDNDDESKL